MSPRTCIQTHARAHTHSLSHTHTHARAHARAPRTHAHPRNVNPDRALMRFEFVEILLRIAIAKYVKTKQTMSISVAFGGLVGE